MPNGTRQKHPGILIVFGAGLNAGLTGASGPYGDYELPIILFSA
jgi:hypothetical protein